MKVKVNPDQPIDWLVVFLILESMDIQESVDALFEEVKKLKLKSSNKIYVLQDSIQHIKNPDNNHISFSLSVSELVYNAQTNETALTPILLDDVDPKHSYAWRDALLQIRMKNKPRASVLITWSHGAGIGIANAKLPVAGNGLTNGIKRNKFNLLRKFSVADRPFESAHFNCSTVEFTKNALVVKDPAGGIQCHEVQDLFISEIADGLKDVADAPVFDMVVMGNCYTQIIDNCYNLNKVAKYYLAPVTLIQTTGYDFGGFIKAINEGIAVTDNRVKQHVSKAGRVVKKSPVKEEKNYDEYFQRIARLFINGYVKINESLEKSEAIIVNDLENILELRPLLNDVCKYFMDNQAEVYPVIDDVLKMDGLAFSDRDFIDVVLLFDTIRKKLRNEEFDTIYRKFRSFLVNNITVDKHIGEELDKDSFHCFSIYIPVSVDNIISQTFCCQYFRGFANSQFVQETEWDNFIIDFTIWRIRKNSANETTKAKKAISKLKSINRLLNESKPVRAHF